MDQLKAGAADIPCEELYRWSRRWLEAQLDLAGKREERTAALRDHLARMCSGMDTKPKRQRGESSLALFEVALDGRIGERRPLLRPALLQRDGLRQALA
jgi:hypothetical protein